eukprot:CAMPEP_0202968210 /NCGR_PEP_ID=MMETSP1396-20130829/13423_1 /ASSEMBLY_ACC=CAM_ASM_000872 /TAXON_ID= /ORGANISM="Pseudokeronopsis sp., Strain Brazil" /LENGTH=50 /DNA_ID=CAMNT_0049694261 /DNA_START=32 /DNA_END=184 /DNA_ORIENTATION=-
MDQLGEGIVDFERFKQFFSAMGAEERKSRGKKALKELVELNFNQSMIESD